MTLTKELIVHAIMGGKQPSMEQCEALVQRGVMKYTGNQHNYSWDWIEEELLKTDVVTLQVVYVKLQSYISAVYKL